MGNKRVSQLIELTSAEVANDDLFLIIDSSAHESKKIQVNNLSAYLNASGSIIAVSADTAKTASWAINVVGNNVSSSYFSLKAYNADSASYALKAELATTASYALNASVTAGTTLITGSTYPITSSWAVAAIASKTASFLLYTAGGFNGTASYAITSLTSSLARSASYLIGSSTTITASYALVAGTTNNVTTAQTASHLIFSPTNGSASYALVAGQALYQGLIRYGMIDSTTQTTYYANIDRLVVSSSLGTPQTTMIQAFGTAILDWTSSIFNNDDISLYITDRLTGQSGKLDKTRIACNGTPLNDNWNSLLTGSYNIPFSLVGQYPLYGAYMLFVSSSGENLKLDTRTVRYVIDSYSNYVTTSYDVAPELYFIPTTGPVTFSTNAGGPFYDGLTGILTTGSNTIKTMNLSNLGILEIRYTWKCTNLTDLSCSNNSNLTSLLYNFPDTMSVFNCSNCKLNSIADLDNTDLTHFDCSYNYLTQLPALPGTVTDLKCSSNGPLINLPNPLPSSSIRLYADGLTSLSTISSLPSTLVTASIKSGSLSSLPTIPTGIRQMFLSSNPFLTTIPDLSTTSMSYLSVSNTGLTTTPSMSISMSWIDLSSNPGFPSSEMLSATNQLVTNGVYSGSFFALGYTASYVTSFYANLLTLQSRAWSITASGFP